MLRLYVSGLIQHLLAGKLHQQKAHHTGEDDLGDHVYTVVHQGVHHSQGRAGHIGQARDVGSNDFLHIGGFRESGPQQPAGQEGAEIPQHHGHKAAQGECHGVIFDAAPEHPTQAQHGEGQDVVQQDGAHQSAHGQALQGAHAQQQLEHAVHQASAQAPLQAAAVAVKQNGQHGAHGDGAAVRSFIQLQKAQDRGHGDHDAAKDQIHCSFGYRVHCDSSPQLDFKKQKPRPQANLGSAANISGIPDPCCVLETLPTPVLPGSGSCQKAMGLSSKLLSAAGGQLPFSIFHF